jgi:glutathione synthase/RimK-type ligase-like ATP-grasp enzyme
MKKRLYFITGKDRFWGQFRKPWYSLDASVLESALQHAGWEVITCEFHDVVNGNIKIQDSYVFYTFSQKDEVRAYYRDVVFSLQQQGNVLLPSYELLLCHENKGFQELYKKRLGLEDLWSLYLSDASEIEKYEIPYPVVLKTLDGSNGRGVFLVDDEKSLRQKLKEITPAYSFTEKLDLLRRKHFRFKKEAKGWPEYEPRDDYYRYAEYIRQTRSFILQEYIPDLEHDFRVLAVHDHFYVTKRHVRKDDFRASGSKLFDFETGDVQEMLDYAAGIAKVFGMPYISLDIVKKAGKFYLLEYQASHFGMNVIKLSGGYYQREEDKWEYVGDKPDASAVLAEGLVRYVGQTFQFDGNKKT